MLSIHTILADFGRAETQFERILALDPYHVDDIDIFSNILYVTENRLRLSRLAHEFLALDKDRPEVCCLVGTLLFGFRLPADAIFLPIRKPLFFACGSHKSCKILPSCNPTGSDIFRSVDTDGARIRGNEEFACSHRSLSYSRGYGNLRSSRRFVAHFL